MNNYIIGSVTRKLRENLNMTQKELAERLAVSDKTISKWETAKGLPDITLIEPLARALNISVAELISGNYIVNKNRAANLARSVIYVCPICGNIIHSVGAASVSCCGIALPPLQAENTVQINGMISENLSEKIISEKNISEKNEDSTASDYPHIINCIKTDGEYYVTVEHEMSREHYISFLAYITDSHYDMAKLYPEGEAVARFPVRGHGIIYCYCNHHGLFARRV